MHDTNPNEGCCSSRQKKIVIGDGLGVRLSGRTGGYRRWANVLVHEGGRMALSFPLRQGTAAVVRTIAHIKSVAECVYFDNVHGSVTCIRYLSVCPICVDV